MKRFASVVASILLLVPLGVSAQEGPISKGSKVVGGSASFASLGGDLYENGDGDRLTSLALSPAALFFVSDGLALGGTLTVERESQGDFDATTLGLGPTVAYYFGEADSDSYPFLSGTVSYANLSTSGVDASGFGFNATAGIVFMLSRTVGLTAAATYRIENLEVDQANDSFGGNTFAIALGIDAFLY